MERAELWVTGIVQGVGFRPFCAREAKALGLTGTVRNTWGGVELLVEGETSVIDEYLRVLWEEHPQAAAVTDVRVRRAPLARRTFGDFSVLSSSTGDARARGGHALIPADLAVCEDCLAEMNDPGNRRYRYPFINCTHCGPRYTLIRALPYDRPLTTMADFPMCPDCEREYLDPANRRYHAQPNACPVCGPKVRLWDPAGRLLCQEEEAIRRLISEISKGKLVAIKGVGGFHIACLPNDAPLGELRLRKHRPDKPFALMVRDMAAARSLAWISPDAEGLLTGVQRPIVLCPAREDAPISPLTAPGQRRLGLMLPYTPLHHLIMEKFEALVMTSGNLGDAPIVSSDEEAFSSLSGVVDFFLCHNRIIHTAVDDSVLLPGESGAKEDETEKKRNESLPIFLRRGRGYVPNPMTLPPLPRDAPNILAAGAQMKATYTLTRGRVLFPGQYLGDLGQLGTAVYYKNSLRHFMGLYAIDPQVLALDKHPGYAAADLAKSFLDLEKVVVCPVQHHHAHLASVLLDNGRFDPVIGVVFDGTGYGDDGTLWGGEFLVGDARGFTRMGSLLPCRLPGGENAIHEPWRYALALLGGAVGGEEAAKIAASLWPEFEARIGPVLAAVEVSPVTTSCGRLFDGFSALLNLCPVATYDGQAAAALENAAESSVVAKRPEILKESDVLSFALQEEESFVRLDWRGAVRSLLDCLDPEPPGGRQDAENFGIENFGIGKSEVGKIGALAAAFHGGLARAVADVCVLLREKTRIGCAALSGGVWQNRLLLDLTCRELRNRGLAVLVHRTLSPNDEGVSAGQAVVAAYTVSGK
ncbi:MAG: carbamoyltransferase HypF [Synergistaceae bacterium]|jgi:hydrogenase maturation protein HypF|nr:carbamoyltransferase HypF [Synergistaceae bacterium]